MRGTTIALHDYRPFPNLAWRNAIQTGFELPALTQALHLPCGAEVLEVGCGPGTALPVLARLLQPTRLVGLDVDPTLLAQAAGAPAELVLGDLHELPFPAESFDVVVDFGTCYHVARPAAAVAEVERVLRPGGVFVYETPLAQLLAHPLRTRGRRLPWRHARRLEPARSALLWATRVKRCA